jgi:hypothetical protein
MRCLRAPGRLRHLRQQGVRLGHPASLQTVLPQLPVHHFYNCLQFARACAERCPENMTTDSVRVCTMRSMCPAECRQLDEVACGMVSRSAAASGAARLGYDDSALLADI